MRSLGISHLDILKCLLGRFICWWCRLTLAQLEDICFVKDNFHRDLSNKARGLDSVFGKKFCMVAYVD